MTAETRLLFDSVAGWVLWTLYVVCVGGTCLWLLWLATKEKDHEFDDFE